MLVDRHLADGQFGAAVVGIQGLVSRDFHHLSLQKNVESFGNITFPHTGFLLA